MTRRLVEWPYWSPLWHYGVQRWAAAWTAGFAAFGIYRRRT